MEINKKKYVTKLRTLIADLSPNDKVGLLTYMLADVVKTEASPESCMVVMKLLVDALQPEGSEE